MTPPAPPARSIAEFFVEGDRATTRCARDAYLNASAYTRRFYLDASASLNADAEALIAAARAYAADAALIAAAHTYADLALAYKHP